eukprot:3204697-Amphidinium_carterae.2
MEWELAEKDDEIKARQRASSCSQCWKRLLPSIPSEWQSSKDPLRQRDLLGELGRLAHNQAVQGMQMQQLAKDCCWSSAARLAVRTSGPLWRASRLELQKVDMENKNLIEYIRRMESKCRQHTSELHSHEGRGECNDSQAGHMLELLMEERMALAAAQLGHQASEQDGT